MVLTEQFIHLSRSDFVSKKARPALIARYAPKVIDVVRYTVPRGAHVPRSASIDDQRGGAP